MELARDFIFCFLRTCTLCTAHTHISCVLSQYFKWICSHFCLFNKWKQWDLFWFEFDTNSILNVHFFLRLCDFVLFCFVLRDSLIWMELLIYKRRWKKSTIWYWVNFRYSRIEKFATHIWLVCHSLRSQSEYVAMTSSSEMILEKWVTKK